MLLGYDIGGPLNDIFRRKVVTLLGTGSGKTSVLKLFLGLRGESLEWENPSFNYSRFLNGSFVPERKDAVKTEKKDAAKTDRNDTADRIAGGTENENCPRKLSLRGNSNKQKPIRSGLAAEVFRKVSNVDFPELKDADKSEYMFIKHAADSIFSNITGEDPLESFCNMSEDTKLLALKMIHDTYCRKLGFHGEQTKVVFGKMNVKEIGAYQYRKKRILINEVLFADPASAEILISALIHETFHEFQMRAAFESVCYSVRKEIVSAWRMNYGNTDAVNYIRYEISPERYARQPVELYAKLVEKGTIQLLLEVSGSQPEDTGGKGGMKHVMV